MKTLVVIPARGGSKGLPNKNIKELHGRPLIYYSIDIAKEIVDDENICLSTDSIQIKELGEQYPLKVPFLRPNDLSKDTSGMEEVLLHALDYYENLGRSYDCILLLQPTSPLRNLNQVREAMDLYNQDLDMVVSVNLFEPNPYYLAYEEENGFLKKSFGEHYTRRQDCPEVYAINGAIYIINTDALRTKGLAKMSTRKKYVMDKLSSIDIDTQHDWDYATYIFSKRMHNEQ